VPFLDDGASHEEAERRTRRLLGSAGDVNEDLGHENS
jgi:hypothetical protein